MRNMDALRKTLHAKQSIRSLARCKVRRGHTIKGKKISGGLWGIVGDCGGLSHETQKERRQQSACGNHAHELRKKHGELAKEGNEEAECVC
jgi:hypothetical protein